MDLAKVGGDQWRDYSKAPNNSTTAQTRNNAKIFQEEAKMINQTHTIANALCQMRSKKERKFLKDVTKSD
jgi:hypothetical protein